MANSHSSFGRQGETMDPPRLRVAVAKAIEITLKNLGNDSSLNKILSTEETRF